MFKKIKFILGILIGLGMVELFKFASTNYLWAYFYNN